MAQPFLITGLPRCREAWLSVLTTTDKTVCKFHPLLDIADKTELPSMFESAFYSHIGLADSSLAFFTGWLLEHVKPRTVIVDRDLEDVQRSIIEIGGARSNVPELMREELLKYREHPLVLWVPYESLAMKRTIQRIFFHLLPGVPFDETRYESLVKMRIGIHLKDAGVEYARNQPQMENLLREWLPKFRTDFNPRMPGNGQSI
jgi:hypothetical protein